ncbi:MAG: alpha/beta hydrolase [Bacteroidia bacterium]|nr:alpha/beta hydrolase [Bacteroidia bacterium]
MLQSYTIYTQDGNLIRASLYGAENFGEQPCVIYVHGFKGFKDWGFVPYIGKKMEENGFCFLTFNFSHNGIGESLMEFAEPELFEKNTYSLELSELSEIIALCADGKFFGNENHFPVFLLGHSRGGGISILSAAENEKVKALVTWASVYTFERFEKSEIQQWKQQGFIETKNTRTGQIFKLGKDMLNDILLNKGGKLNILNAVKRLNVPFLIIHGDKDTSVHFYEAEQLNLYSSPSTTHYELIKGADHTFGAKHPFEESTPELERAIQATIEFYKKIS